MKNIKVIDANIILRYLLDDNEELSKKARDLVDQAIGLKIEILIKELVIAEVVYVLEKFYKVNRKEIADVLERLISLRGIKTENKEFVKRALKIYSEKKLDFVDCVLCAMGEDYHIETYDRKLKRCISG